MWSCNDIQWICTDLDLLVQTEGLTEEQTEGQMEIQTEGQFDGRTEGGTEARMEGDRRKDGQEPEVLQDAALQA